MSSIGFGIIGCGNIAGVHAQSIVEIDDADLIGVANVPGHSGAEKMAKTYGAQAFNDFNEMLQRDDLDVVCLCVPSGARLEAAVACAEAGKHIIAEKPLEVTTERIDQLIAAVDKAGVKLGCIFQYRFANGPQHIRKAVEAGRFGKLVLGDAYIKWYRDAAYYASGAWRGTWKLDGGGVLMNQGIHQIDLLLWFMGPAKSVTAQTDLVGHEGLEVEDLATAMIKFENGAMGVIEGSTAIWPGHPARVEVHGTQGSAAMEDGEIVSWQFAEEQPDDATIRASEQGASTGSGARDPMKSLKHEAHKRQIEEFMHAVRDDRPPSIDGREGRRAVELIEAIYRSAKTSQTIVL
jgi:UDP-N-acetyl-2-amino-2-deoxyglucuronate dehydrogenase